MSRRPQTPDPGPSLRILVTAGPTREYIDPIRFLSNESSGRMGYAIAAAAKERGHSVTLISGPVALDPPAGVKPVCIVSAAQLRAAVRNHFRRCEVLVMTAAVADYRPVKRIPGKLKRSGRSLTLRMRPTVDIVAEVAAKKGRRCVVGFALEIQSPRRSAVEKLQRKQLDLIVLNGPANLAVASAAVTLFWPDGRSKTLSRRSKAALAAGLLKEIERLISSRRPPRMK